MAVSTKDGVLFTTIAPGGFEILHCITWTSDNLNIDLVITSACDGEHSGPDDPHHRGEAYDVRSHEFNSQEKNGILGIFNELLPVGRFYAFLEDAGTENEHFHIQVKKGTTYP